MSCGCCKRHVNQALVCFVFCILVLFVTFGKVFIVGFLGVLFLRFVYFKNILSVVVSLVLAIFENDRKDSTPSGA